MPTVRLLPFDTAPGPTLMAADDALLQSAAAGVASLRFYAWSEPTVTLGYFQPAADRERFPALPWVRRATGGAALVHHHELTYALAVPPGKDWHDPHLGWLCRFHYTIRDALKPLGATLRAVVCGQERDLGPALCFLKQTPGDLLCDAPVGPAVPDSSAPPRPAQPDLRVRSPGGAKVVGSAQRKRAGAVLQHGGILLRRSEHALELAGLAELCGVRLSPETVAAAVTERFAADTGFAVEPGDWTAEEYRHRAEVERDVYRSAGWNNRR